MPANDEAPVAGLVPEAHAEPSPSRTTVRYCCTCSAIYRTDFKRCPNDGGVVAESAMDPLLGQTLGDRYVIEAVIGEGAMGRVYRAHHRTLANQRYAIKVLIGDYAVSATMRARFAREAEHAAKLDHPNVVKVVDVGCTDHGLHYLVMDLVVGDSLAKLIGEGPMAADRVIRIAHQLCEGLEHAHSRGVIHRDFKPENILVTASGSPFREVPRIADFGLAMSTDNDPRLTTTGVACTPAYAAPEQLRGAHIDCRTDLYGLGVTMFEMLSGGYLPFDGDYDATISAKLTREAPSILTLAPNVPAGLVAIITRLLAHEPSQRPRSARAVIRALETSLTWARPEVRTVDMRPLARKRWRRTTLVKGAVLGVAIAAMAAVAQLADDRPANVPAAAAATVGR